MMRVKRRITLFSACFFSILLTVSSAYAAARSTNVVIKNNTNRTLTFVSGKVNHGIVTQKPPKAILPGGIGELSGESNGMATGTEGSVTYRLDGINGAATFHWDNPFVGSNSAQGSAPAGFQVEQIGNKGNRTVVFFSIHDTNNPVAVCNADWVITNLGTHPEEELDDFDKGVGFLSTPFKRLGFGGWVDTGCEASAQGWLVRNAQHSTDGFWTIDVRLHEFTINGKTASLNQQRFVRIEVEPKTPAHARAAGRANQYIQFSGRVLIDTHHGEKLIEVHPWNPITLAVESTNQSQPPNGFRNQRSYAGDCKSRPPGTVCIGFPDHFVWLVSDEIINWRTSSDGKIVSALGARAEYSHILGTNFVAEISRRR